MTNFSPARIRKWQERYRIFEPTQGSNGYWYYTNEDYLVLRSIQQRLALGQKLSHVMSLGREHLLNNLINDEFSEEEWKLIQWIKDSSYKDLGKYVEEKRDSGGLAYTAWIRTVLQPLVLMTGRAWETGFLSVTEEHAFSRWFQGFVQNSIREVAGPEKIDWLVVTFPGDEHELGALMHAALLQSRNKGVRFAGHLPKEELLREIREGEYRNVSISCVLPQAKDKIEALRRDIKGVDDSLRVYFGGYMFSDRDRSQVTASNGGHSGATNLERKAAAKESLSVREAVN